MQCKIHDDVTYVYDDVTYVYDDVTYVLSMQCKIHMFAALRSDVYDDVTYVDMMM